jgi:transcriptional regulator with XRE-family HTH domain
MLSEKIRLCRKQAGLSQEELADQLEVSRQAISKWEMGQSAPDPERIVRMSELFGVSTDALLKEEYAPAAAAAPQPAPQSLRHAGKVYIIDINNRKLSAFDTFELEPVAFAGKGEAAVIGGGQAGQIVRVPVCGLFGIGRGFLGLKRRSLLGMYATMEDARKELAAIAEQSGERASYQLRYACKMDGVRIAE